MCKKVSIIVPVYNCEECLRICLMDLLHQTYAPIEIILIDDGSADSSPEICDAFAAEYAHIRVVHKKNEGAAAARRDGVLQASGEYLVFVDADDRVDADHVSLLMQYADRADMVVGTFRRFLKDAVGPIEECRFSGYYDRNRLEREVFPQMLSSDPFYTFGIAPSMCGKLMKREIALKNCDALGMGITIGEDGCFTYSVLLDCSDVYFMGYCGYRYRQNEASATRSFRKRELLNTRKIYSFFEKLAKEKGWDSQRQIEEYIAWVCVQTTAKAIRMSFLQSKSDQKELEEYIDTNFPNSIWHNPKFLRSSMKNKILYLLIKWHAFPVLKMYFKIGAN